MKISGERERRGEEIIIHTWKFRESEERRGEKRKEVENISENFEREREERKEKISENFERERERREEIIMYTEISRERREERREYK